MDTIVTVEVVRAADDADGAGQRIEAALGWFGVVEHACSRFEPGSELRRLCARPGEHVPVSELLFAAVEFACELARRTGGAFDPAIGGAMEAAGFDRNYRTGEHVHGPGNSRGSWRDIELDARARCIRLARPVTLDLGAIAKGLAVDLAAQELSRFPGFVIDAGGDIFAGGANAAGKPWQIGVRDPARGDGLLETFRLSGQAICTSGSYERVSATGASHILDPLRPAVAARTTSATVIAPTAMAADALSTAAFVLGPKAGIRLLEREGVDGVIYGPGGCRAATRGMESYRDER